MWWIIAAIWISIGGAFAFTMRDTFSFLKPWIFYPVFTLLGPIGPIVFFWGKT